MNDFAHTCVPLVLQASVLLAFSAAIVQVLIWRLRPASPTVQRIVWASLLLQGLLLFHLPVKVAWHEARAATEVVSAPVVTMDESLAREVPHVVPEPLKRTPTPVAVESIPAEPGHAVAPEAPVRRVDRAAILLTVWFVGMVGLAALFGVSYSRILWRLARSRPAPDDWAEPWRRLLAEANIRRPIPLRVTERIGPVLCRTPGGYRVYVPKSVWSELTEPQRLSILRHELAHFRRGDLWKTLLVRLVALPHWFNPAAWWAVRRFAECAEWACDEAACRSDSADYAAALLQLGSPDVSLTSCATAAGGSSLYHRIRRVVSTHSRKDSAMKRISFFAVAAILLAAAVVRVELVAHEAPEARVEQRMPWAPEELVRVLGDEKGRQWGHIASMAVSPDGMQVATAGEDGNVFLWDTKTLELQSMISGGGKGVFWVSYSADGQRLITVGRDEVVRLWDISGSEPKSVGQIPFQYPPNSSYVRAYYESSVRCSDDGQTVAVRATNAEILLLRSDGEQLKQTAVITLPAPHPIRFTPEHRRLAKTVGSRSMGARGGGRVIALSPDGNTLAVASDGGFIIMSDHEDQQILHTAFVDSTVQLWDLQGAEPVLLEASARAPSVETLAFSPDGRTLAGGSTDGSLRLWKILDDRFEEPDIRENTGPAKDVSYVSRWGALVFAPDGKTLAAHYLGRIRVWDTSNSTRSRREIDLGYRYGSKAIAFAPDGQSLFVGDRETVRRWDLTESETDFAAITSQHSGGLSSLGFVPRSEQLLVTGAEDVLQIVDYASVDADEPTLLMVDPGQCRDIVVSPDGSRFAFSHSVQSEQDWVYSFRVWDWSNGQPREWATLKMPNVVRGNFGCAAFGPDTSTLFTGHFDGRIRAWALSEKEPELLMSTKQVHAGGVCSLHASPSGTRLASGGHGRAVCLWEIVDGQPQAMRTLGQHEDTVDHVEFSPDEKLLASSDGAGVTKLWDLTMREPRFHFLQSDTTGWTGYPRFSPNGKTLLTSSLDGCATLWDTATRRPLKEWNFPGPGFAMFSPDGEHIATANGNGSIYIMALPK